MLRFDRGRFRLIGAADRTWDWNRVEASTAWLAYHTIQAALAAARRCAHATAPLACIFQPRLARTVTGAAERMRTGAGGRAAIMDALAAVSLHVVAAARLLALGAALWTPGPARAQQPAQPATQNPTAAPTTPPPATPTAAPPSTTPMPLRPTMPVLPPATCPPTTRTMLAAPVGREPAAAEGQPLRLTLAEALARAEAANARLPVAAAGVAIARQGVREARARLYPKIYLDGDVHAGYPAAYASSDARLQLMATDTLYAGGALRAGRRVAEYRYRSAGAGYRVGQKDVALDVRLRFAQGLRYQREVVIRSEGIVRLRAYLIWLEARQAAGQGVAADVLRTRARVAAEEANIADAERLLDEAQVELNELMGRDPRAELELVPLPPPVPPPPPTDEPWLGTPDVLMAQFDAAVARFGVAIARAERRPLLWATVNAGWQPAFGPQPSPLNIGTGAGVEALVGFTLPLFDFGGYRARLGMAELQAVQARDSFIVVRRQAHLAWARAVEDLDDLYRVWMLRDRTVPVARDSYLLAEAVYRGGAGTALEVLDAYTTWIDAEVARAQAAMNYRQAEAQLIRWGTP